MTWSIRSFRSSFLLSLSRVWFASQSLSLILPSSSYPKPISFFLLSSLPTSTHLIFFSSRISSFTCFSIWIDFGRYWEWWGKEFRLRRLTTWRRGRWLSQREEEGFSRRLKSSQLFVMLRLPLLSSLQLEGSLSTPAQGKLILINYHSLNFSLLILCLLDHSVYLCLHTILIALWVVVERDMSHFSPK